MKTLIKPKATESIWLYSMGKRFELMAVATDNDSANDYCAKHQDAAVIACFGPLVFIANQYAGVKSGQQID